MQRWTAPHSLRGRIARGVVASGTFVACVLAILAGSPLQAATSAAASENAACDEAIEAFDAEHSGRSDARAMEAVQALVRTCASPDALRARAESRVGVIYYRRHDLPAAAASFEEAVRLAPGNVTLHLSLCGVYTEASRHQDAIDRCLAGLDLAREQDDGTTEKHDLVLRIGYNLALAKMRRGVNLCRDHSIFEMLEAFRAAHDDDAWVHQALGAWAWDCDDDFERGLALYKRSCSLGQESACQQVRYTESCQCRKRLKG